jgi:5'-methylthioadenosine phosphorylase
VASVGGVRADLSPGKLIVPDQIIDYTHGRSSTYFDGREQTVTHIDFTLPYSQQTRALLLQAAKHANETVFDGGVYAATQGPRLETAAEINRLAGDGADIVGMTGMPEAALARELGLNYATIAVIANYAAGRGTNACGIPLHEIYAVLEQAMIKVRKILEHIASCHGD